MAHNTIGIKFYAFGGNHEVFMKIVDGTTTINSVVLKDGTDYTLNFLGLQEIGEIGFHEAVGSNGYDRIEVTTLADTEHKYINGLVADSSDTDSNNELSLKFLYDKAQFQLFKSLQKEKANNGLSFYIELPDGTLFGLKAYVKDVVLDTLTVGSAMTYGVTLSVNKMDFVTELDKDVAV